MNGIICALSAEAELIKAKMKYARKTTVSGIEFTKGKLDSKDTVIAVCGVGKVAAAVCTQTMIMKYKPDFIINTGVGGSLRSSLHCGDIAIATSVVQHDMDTTALGDPLGLISGINKTNFACSASHVEKLLALAEEKGLRFKKGVIASGDTFIADKEKKTFLKLWFNAISCDMESGAVGHVCYLNNVPFCIIRAISDEANGNASMDYPTFMKKAADTAAEFVCEFLGGTECEN